MAASLLNIRAREAPPLDSDFMPAALGNRNFQAAVKASGGGVPLIIGLERSPGSVSVYRTAILDPKSENENDNHRYVERVVKMLLWQKGGHRIVVAGAPEVGRYIKSLYAPGGQREFDAKLMAGVYEKAFTVDIVTVEQAPEEREKTTPRGGHLDGCRIGFDAGASDRKVAAVVDGKVVYSEEVIWNPKEKKDPQYHFDEIDAAFKAAAAHLKRVDAIGVSSAGIYIDNRAMVASLFRGIPADLFEKRIKPIFLDLRKKWDNVPLEVCNDGAVTALAGSMNLKDGAVLGIAMGSSEAAGYVTTDGYLTEWLDELAFAPVDYNPEAPIDEWSGDAGCGVQYFSQVAAIRLARTAGLSLAADATPAEKLKAIQAALAKGHAGARNVFESIGCYLGYALAQYADFYEIRHVLLLGRVTSGEGGDIVIGRAAAILKNEFPDLHDRIKIHVPEEESERRVGQAIAAASLPSIPPKT